MNNVEEVLMHVAALSPVQKLTLAESLFGDVITSTRSETRELEESVMETLQRISLMVQSSQLTEEKYGCCPQCDTALTEGHYQREDYLCPQCEKYCYPRSQR